MTTDIFWLLICHLIGDYVLQSDFIAKTKGENWYHLFVHSALYCAPFAIMFGLGWGTMFLFTTHVFVDAGKARWNLLSYTQDQIWHYIALWLFWTSGGCI